MKKRNIFFSVFIALMLVFSINTVNATSIVDKKQSNDAYKTSEDDSAFDTPFYRSINNRVTIDKEITQMGLIIATSGVDVNAIMKSPQFILANDTVRINADMEDAIIVGTGSVIVNANVDNIITIAGSSITIGENGNIKENLLCITGDLKLDSNVDGNIIGTANTIELNSTINGQFRVQTSNITFGENAKLNSTSIIKTYNEGLSVPETVGTATIEKIEKLSFGKKVKNYLLNLLLFVMMDMVAYGIIMIFVKKDRMEKLVKRVSPKALVKNGLVTFLVALGCIIFGLTLALFVLPQVGLSAVIIGLAIMIVFTLLKNIIVGTFIANLPSDRLNNLQVKPNKILMAIMTFIMLEVLGTIPILGTVFKFMTFIFATGIIVSMIIGKKENNITTPENTNKDDEEKETIIAK